MNNQLKNFTIFIDNFYEKGGLRNDDIVAIFLPLISDVILLHEQGFVSGLNKLETLRIEEYKLLLNTEGENPKNNVKALQNLFKQSKAFEIISEITQETNIDDSTIKYKNKNLEIEV